MKVDTLIMDYHVGRMRQYLMNDLINSEYLKLNQSGKCEFVADSVNAYCLENDILTVEENRYFRGGLQMFYKYWIMGEFEGVVQ